MSNSAPSTQCSFAKPASSIERRRADGSLFYDEEEFKQYYGHSKYKEKWNAACVCSSHAPVGSNAMPNSSVAQPASSHNAPASCASEVWLEQRTRQLLPSQAPDFDKAANSAEKPGSTSVNVADLEALVQQIAAGLEALKNTSSVSKPATT